MGCGDSGAFRSATAFDSKLNVYKWNFVPNFRTLGPFGYHFVNSYLSGRLFLFIYSDGDGIVFLSVFLNVS
jgi:hypothetical protein